MTDRRRDEAHPFLPLSRRRFALGGVSLLAAASLIGCGGEGGENGEAGEGGAAPAQQGALAGRDDKNAVNIYSARHYPADEKLFALFTKETGLKVNMLQGPAEDLMQRIKLEGENSPADVFITVDAGNLWRAQSQGIFQPVRSEELEGHIPASLREPGGHWFGFATRARVILYDKEKADPAAAATYESLADPRWRGKVLVRSSNNIYNQSLLASIIAADGAGPAEAWAKGLVANFARKPQGGDIEQIKALAAGEGEIALSNTYYFARLLSGEEPELTEKLGKVGIIFPNQGDRGTHVNVSGGGMAAHAPHPDNARKFLEFLVSSEAQEIFSGANFEFPVRDGAKAAPIVAAWGDFKKDSLNVARLGELNADAVMIMDRAGWK